MQYECKITYFDITTSGEGCKNEQKSYSQNNNIVCPNVRHPRLI